MMIDLAAPALNHVKNCYKSKKYAKYRKTTEGSFCKKTYKDVQLCSRREVVRHSFIVQNSISHLDLQLSKLPLSNTEYFQVHFLNTEEKCRKFHCHKRNILYNLNLDLPKGREWSLKNKPCPKYADTKGVWIPKESELASIAEISIHQNLYFNMLCSFFTHVCEQNGPLEKLLMWFEKCSQSKDGYLFRQILDEIHGCIKPGLAKECLAKLDLKCWMEFNGKPERLGNLLYLLHRNSNISERNKLCDQLDHLFLHPSFLYTGEVLKLLNEPHLCQRFVSLLKSEIGGSRGSFISRRLIRVVQGKSVRRCALLLHLYWTYMHRSSHPVSCAESLRLVWNSVSDAFIGYDELAAGFKLFLPRKIDDICQFYSTSVGDYGQKVEPRSLQQYCRSSIRRELWKNNRWLPDGIEKLGLPKTLQSYLKLENKCSR